MMGNYRASSWREIFAGYRLGDGADAARRQPTLGS